MTPQTLPAENQDAFPPETGARAPNRPAGFAKKASRPSRGRAAGQSKRGPQLDVPLSKETGQRSTEDKEMVVGGKYESEEELKRLATW